MKKLLIILLIISILSLTGCQLMEYMYEEPVEAPAEETPQAAIDEVESSINEIGALEQELDISELDDLEKDLEEIDW